jgi:hypothetical protein
MPRASSTDPRGTRIGSASIKATAERLSHVLGFWVGHRHAGARRISPCRTRGCGVKRERKDARLEDALLAIFSIVEEVGNIVPVPDFRPQ